jgi:cobalt/nickel transport system permease protein
LSGNHSGGHLSEWALGDSWLHRREARAKILAALVLLVGLSLSRSAASASVAVSAWLLVIATGTAGLPVIAILVRAAAVLPFAVTFAAITWLAGDAERAQALLAKSLLSAWTVVLLIASTPITALLTGFERLGVPVLLTEVILLLVRYLTVLGEQALALRRAATSRGASGWGALPWGTRPHREAGAGMIAALFRDAVDRSTRIHQAMLARGFTGRFPTLHPKRWSVPDSLLVVSAVAVVIGVQWLR